MSAFAWLSPSVVGSKIPCENERAGPQFESPASGYGSHLTEAGPRRWPATTVPWLAVGFFVLLLAIESTAMLGTQHTSAPLHKLLGLVFGGRIDENWSLLHHLLRKTGHFVGYGTFGLLCRRAWKRSCDHSLYSVAKRERAPWLKPSPAAFGILATAVAASADELHQRFVPGRSGAMSDVLLDISGAIVLQLCRAGFKSVRRALSGQPGEMTSYRPECAGNEQQALPTGSY